MSVKYLPRNDYCLIRMVDLGQTPTGIAMPAVAQQGKQWHVEAIGPDVEGLEVGDEVLLMGEIGQDIARLPNEKSLFLLKQANVLVVLQRDKVVQKEAG